MLELLLLLECMDTGCCSSLRGFTWAALLLELLLLGCCCFLEARGVSPSNHMGPSTLSLPSARKGGALRRRKDLIIILFISSCGSPPARRTTASTPDPLWAHQRRQHRLGSS